jgi:hypothetical protein
MSYVGGVTGTGGGGAFSQTFLMLTAALLLLPPCANMAILIYARTVTRQREFTTRHALGGSRARIVGQLYLEALLLVAGATVTSLIVVSQVGRYFQTMIRLPHGNPFWLDFGVIQPETMLFAVGIGALAAVIVGIAPALRAVGRLTDAAALGGRSSLTLGAGWTGMVATQVAISIAIIPVVGEVAWGTIRPAIGGPGFAAEQFLTARVTLGRAEDSTLAERGEAKRFERLQSELVTRLEALREVTVLTRSAVVPGTEQQLMFEVDRGNHPVAGTDRAGALRQVLVRANAVETTFFDAFGMGVVAGRIFDRTRGQTAQVVVNRALARHLARDGNPVGWRLRDRSARGAQAESGPWQEIVGVVDDQHASNGHRTLYRPLHESQHPLAISMKLTSRSPHVAQRLHELGAEIDSDLHVSAIRSLADVEQDSTRGVYLVGLMFGSGALSVLLLSAAGIYALMSFTVARRRREIGIRSALGARATRLLAGILGRAARQIVIGSIAGVLLALWLGAYLPVEAIGGARIPGLIPVAASIMLIVGLLAAAGPARRALRLDPTEALRDN